MVSTNSLNQIVLEYSESYDWFNAVQEWEILDCEEDANMLSSCLCGKENIKYLFTIYNRINGNILYPIGSSCIRKFERADLNNLVIIKESMFKLLRAIQEGRYISLSSDLFSRKLLTALYDEGAFKPNKYNGFDGENDYEFVLEMFNKRNKDSITESQNRKVRAIILNSIKPHLIRKLNDKIKRR